MRLFVTASFLCLASVTFSQTIVNLVWVGDKGITENVNEAKSLVVIKKYPAGFERLDYKIFSPLKKLRTYSDSTLSILEGIYCEYAENGMITKSGFLSK